jgi:hypothetical protein
MAENRSESDTVPDKRAANTYLAISAGFAQDASGGYGGWKNILHFYVWLTHQVLSIDRYLERILQDMATGMEIEG